MRISEPVTDEWITPKVVKEQLLAMFNFTLDPFADAENAICHNFITKEQDAFNCLSSWDGNRVFMNPPYSRVAEACEIAYLKTLSGEVPLVVGLLASRTGSSWYHSFIEGKAIVIPYRGRISFKLPCSLKDRLVSENKIKGDSSPQFDSILVIWHAPLRRK